jgi:hypothetical protein
MSLLDTLKSHLEGDTLKNLAAKVGVDPEQAKAAIASALPAILGGLAKNSEKPEGADRLDKALDKHQEGPLAKLTAAGPDLLAEGKKIMGHIFGNKQDQANGAVAKSSGLDLSKVTDLLAGIAPMVLGVLGQKKKDENLDASGVAKALQEDNKKVKATGILGFLDTDGDGEIMDDVIEKGKGLLSGGMGSLGGLFGKSVADKKDEPKAGATPDPDKS